ncbi:hypothetical protein SLS53_008533 [Cytospora paraplurivora]|uniref:Uncharacterized protein n=1 Tax=Cytospora paraplurivora TaxID=2898453 RepID=A0AAN9YCP9_9PEZI
MAEVASTPAAMTVEEGTETDKALPPPVCVLDAGSDTSEVASTALGVDVGELELASTVAVTIEEGTVIVTAPPAPVCALEVVSDGCAAAKIEISLDWTAVVAADEGSVTVNPRPPTVCFFEVISDVFNSVEIELPLGWIVAVTVDEEAGVEGTFEEDTATDEELLKYETEADVDTEATASTVGEALEGFWIEEAARGLEEGWREEPALTVVETSWEIVDVNSKPSALSSSEEVALVVWARLAGPEEWKAAADTLVVAAELSETDCETSVDFEEEICTGTEGEEIPVV